MTDVVARLRQLEAAATPGPWEEFVSPGGIVVVHGLYDVATLALGNSESQRRQDNCALIAAARNALPRLLDELELLRVVAKAAPHVLDALVDIHPMDAGEPCHIYEACVMLNTALAALDSQETE